MNTKDKLKQRLAELTANKNSEVTNEVVKAAPAPAIETSPKEETLIEKLKRIKENGRTSDVSVSNFVSDNSSVPSNTSVSKGIETKEAPLTMLEQLRKKLEASKSESAVEVKEEVAGGEVTMKVMTLQDKIAEMKKIESGESNFVPEDGEEVESFDKHEVTFEMLNDAQKLGVRLGSSGKSFCLIGSAGSGKTTTQRMVLEELSKSGFLGKRTEASKYLPIGIPKVLVTAFTKVATRNIKSAAPEEFKRNCINIHKAIEFAPEKVTKEILDTETGVMMEVDRMNFVPQRNRYNPLSDVQVCIIEEAGSLDVELFAKLVDALPKNCIYIFLGDLNQLPPVYGASILGFAITKLPIVELTQNYRQGIGPIKELASMILDGQPLKGSVIKELSATSRKGANLFLKPMTKSKKVNNGITLNKGIGDYLRMEVLNGNFVEGESIVLCPIRKDSNDFLNIAELNRHVAQTFSTQRNMPTFEIRSKSISGGTYYYAEGDLVFLDREYYKIIKITENPKYVRLYGYDFKPASLSLDRWGRDSQGTAHDIDFNATEDIDSTVSNLLNIELEDAAESKNVVSHFITLASYEKDDEQDITYELELRSPGELQTLQLGYAQTIHSSQGSEWKNVYLCAPENVMFMYNREMLYVGVSRARENLTVFYEDGTCAHNIAKGTFQSGIRRQAIKGDTLKDKIKFFKELYKNMAYEAYPKMLEELNKYGTITIERYWNEGSDNNEGLKIERE